MPSLSLGTGEVTPLDLTAAFAMFPNGGFAVRPRGIVRVIDADGGTAYDNPVAYRARDLSADRVPDGVDARRRHRPRHRRRRRAAGASGFPPAGRPARPTISRTHGSSGSRRRVVAGVWVGFDQPKTIGRDALRLAVRAADLERLHAPRGSAPSARRHSRCPPACTRSSLCNVSYLRPVEECPVYIEYFKENDDVPSRLCPLHRGTVKQRVKRAFEGLSVRASGGSSRASFDESLTRSRVHA